VKHIGIGLAMLAAGMGTMAKAQDFQGAYIEGKGDKAFLQALDNAYAMTQPSSKMACLPMLYRTEWNGLVEGPTWDAWWIQNSFGPSYTMMPFLTEPYQTWLTNSQAMWYTLMGDGKRADRNGFVAPAGCLCDAATPTFVYYRQGDGDVVNHDWCIGFTIAGLLLESELMLIKRDPQETGTYLPKLEQVAAFIDSRRDPQNNLLLGGVGSNLLAPSFGGWLQTNGKREKAYLTELSVNYVAALNRLIEVCKLAGQPAKAKKYVVTRDKVKKALPLLMTPEGYFIQSLNPDGTQQGVLGAKQHSYFESAPNHDAMCFRVVNDEQAKTIYEKIKSIPQLRPFKLILPNYPSYDSMYESKGLFQYGIWVNGGHWTTAEARMMMGYARVGAWDDALAAFNRLFDLATAFRADNPLTGKGSTLYQPSIPYNVVYDNWGAPGALLRGVLEYEYTAEGLRLYPHLPKGVTELQQRFPVCFGKRLVYISVAGSGPITRVLLDGKPVIGTHSDSVLVRLASSEGVARIQVCLGGAQPIDVSIPVDSPVRASLDPDFTKALVDKLQPRIEALAAFYNELLSKRLQNTYEARQAKMVVDLMNARNERRRTNPNNEVRKSEMAGVPLTGGAAIDQLYLETVEKLVQGLLDYLQQTKSTVVHDAAQRFGLL
jgi:hypothetical protein